MLPQFLAYKPVQIASITDSFVVLFSKLLKLWPWMQTQNSFRGTKSYSEIAKKYRLLQVKVAIEQEKHFGWIFFVL